MSDTYQSWGPHYALGTYWYITLPTAVEFETAVFAAWNWLSVFEAAYSRFRDDSLVSQLNRDGTLKNPPAELRELLDIGVTWYRQSNGVFNFLTGNVQHARGYDADLSFTERDSTPIVADPTTDLTYDDIHVTLTQGAIDFGGFGKGYAVDAVAQLVREQTNSDFVLVNGGGDLYLHNPQHREYPLYLTAPWDSAQYTHLLSNYHGGLASSSPQIRQWTTRNNHSKHSHLVDPHDLTRATTSLASATALGPQTLTADILATLLTLHTNTSEVPLLPNHSYIRIFADGSSRQSGDFLGTPLCC
jgi:thiamine biosynthesis lipoprotein